MVNNLELLKVNTMKIILILSSLSAFIVSYLTDITMDNINQYLAVIAVISIDGFFGIWAGIKREGFITNKAIRVLKNISFWVIILTVILMVEEAFTGTEWLSETIIAPLLIFQIISTLKNAYMVGVIKGDVITSILEKIDPHKDHPDVEADDDYVDINRDANINDNMYDI